MEEKKKVRDFLSTINPFYYPERLIAFLSVSSFVFAFPMISSIGGNLPRWISEGASVLFIFFAGMLLIGMPLFLTAINLLFVFSPKGSERVEKARKKLEITTILFGAACTYVWVWLFDMAKDVVWKDYPEQLINNQLHSPIATHTAPTLIILFIVSLAGYCILRTKKLSRLSPIITAFSISALYLGIILCALWIIQVIKHDLLSCLYSANMILIYINTVKHTVADFADNFADRPEPKINL